MRSRLILTAIVFAGGMIWHRADAAADDDYFKLARSLSRAGNYNEAIIKLTSAIGYNPKFADAYMSRAFNYMRMNRFDKVVPDCDKALDLLDKKGTKFFDYSGDFRQHNSPTRAPRERIFTLRAYALLKLKQYDRAILDYDQLIALHPTDEEAYFNRGKAYERIGNTAFAQRDLRRAKELNYDPQAAAIRKEGARIQRKGQSEEALPYMHETVRLNPRSPKGYLARGKLYLELEDFPKAIADFSQVVYLDSGNARSYLERASAYMQSGDLQKSIDDCTKGLTIDPKLAELYDIRAKDKQGLNKFAEACQDFSEEIKLKPTAPVYVERARSYIALRNYEPAVADCEQALKLSPQASDAYAARGEAYKGLKQYDKSVADYSKLIKLNSKDDQLYLTRADVFMQMGRYQKAVDDLKTAIALAPKDYADPYFARGNAYFALAKYKPAVDDFTHALELARKQQYYLRRAAAYEKLGEHARAVADIEISKLLKP